MELQAIGVSAHFDYKQLFLRVHSKQYAELSGCKARALLLLLRVFKKTSFLEGVRCIGEELPGQRGKAQRG